MMQRSAGFWKQQQYVNESDLLMPLATGRHTSMLLSSLPGSVPFARQQ